jgi:hypothetical protein
MMAKGAKPKGQSPPISLLEEVGEIVWARRES